ARRAMRRRDGTGPAGLPVRVSGGSPSPRWVTRGSGPWTGAGSPCHAGGGWPTAEVTGPVTGPSPAGRCRRPASLSPGDSRRLGDVLPGQLVRDDPTERADLGPMGPEVGLAGMEAAAVEYLLGHLDPRVVLEQDGGIPPGGAGQLELPAPMVERVDPIVE